MSSTTPTPRGRRFVLCLLAVTIAMVSAGAVDATAGSCSDCVPYTFLVSASSTGGIPNGPSRNAAISRDERIASVVAFESDASNIVGGDTNGLTDVFIALRAKPYGTNGTRWRMGARKRASIGLGGKPANGRSYKPAVSGTGDVAPKCVAFVSDASNLVAGDTNGRPDAFLYDVTKATTRRISVSSSGAQSNGTTFDVSVDGSCTRVAFSSNASNLDLNSTSRGQWKSAVTSAPRAGTRQVFSRFVEEPEGSSGLKGLTFLASATNGTPGNGDSYEATVATGKGDAVGFTSKATNLASSDRSAITDIYWRQMPLVRISSGLTPKLTTYLISRSRDGTSGGNGASSQPASSGSRFDSSLGSNIAYQTLSTNVGSGFPDGNQVPDVVRTNLKSGKTSSHYLSNGQSCRTLGNGPSQRPTISESGSTVMYDSDASNFTCRSSTENDRNGAIADVFVWTENRQGSILFSFETNKKALTFDSRNPVTSARINYYMWETRDPFADIVMARRSGYYDDPPAVRAQARQDPRFSQVYMRYGGPE